MSLGRRKIRVGDSSAWVFNRMADDYAARPPYPEPLIDALGALAPPGGRILDLGAGIGHLTIPLAERGFELIAVEPAERMLERLRAAASEQNLALTALHAAAEALPLPAGHVDLIVIADAVHFLDRELAAHEIARVLGERGALAFVTSEFADTPFMNAVLAIMEESAPRRPRDLASPIAQVAALARVSLGVRHFEDTTSVDPHTLERILGSISFIGPAMNPDRTRRFRARIHALPDAPVWSRTFALHSGRRGGGTV